MGLLGISLIVASVVYVILRPPPWIPPQFIIWRGLLRQQAATPRIQATAADEKQKETQRPESKDEARRVTSRSDHHEVEVGPRRRARAEPDSSAQSQTQAQHGTTTPSTSDEATRQTTSSSMPPPPLPLPPTILQPPTITEPDSEEQTTPKAAPSQPSISVPSFSLTNDFSPVANARPTPAAPGVPAFAGSMMPPPPPGRLPPSGRVPSLAQFPAANSAQRARGPTPNRGPAPSSSLLGGGLAPPPTHSSKPSKPNRKVLLTPGHSPLDWARISGPNADLRGVPPSTSYLRVTPSMLKKMTGRKGKDAWMALNGKVYNITPYADYHPGGVPELLRGAARDGTKLFGEIHPWVNYETMLSACMVGLLVEETEANVNQMDEMD